MKFETKIVNRGKNAFYTAIIYIIVMSFLYIAIAYFLPQFFNICDISIIDVYSNSTTISTTWENNIQFVLAINIFTFLGLFIFEIVKRLFLLTEEWKHMKTRYEGNLIKLLSEVFTFSKSGLIKICIALTLSLIFVFYLLATKNYLQTDTWKLLAHIVIVQIGLAPSLAYVLKIKNLSNVEEDELNEHCILHIAQGLAWSFYIGYLKIILPEFVERIKDPHGHLKIKKLLILCPYSCKLPNKISDVDISITSVETPSIVSINKHVAAINRYYTNTVYQISTQGKEEYLILEYCTPLKTFCEMSKNSCYHFTDYDKKKQLRLFVKIVTDLVEADENCKNKCILRAFDDTVENFSLHSLLLDFMKEELSSTMNGIEKPLEEIPLVTIQS